MTGDRTVEDLDKTATWWTERGTGQPSWGSRQLSGTTGRSPGESPGRPYTVLCRSAMSLRMSAISRSRKSKEPGGP
ncbi:hypothetical protein EYF80_004315 [Liparis tanakae]|uniref:Uncharacterized protein n=1 Tax=Liparis tanakae TaxID=230148 RepID=A0A4Z2J6V7_9TELE|nr:hypothetical protein EYF80_004315 [Liparis tanakae]